MNSKILLYCPIPTFIKALYPSNMAIGAFEILLLLLVVGLLAWAFGAGRLPGSQRERGQRLDQALVEIRRQGERLSHLREAMRRVQSYARDLGRLLPQMAELERFLAKSNLDLATRDRLLARHNDLSRIFEVGTEYLERLGAELLLVQGTQQPAVLAELSGLIVQLREALQAPKGKLER